MGLWTAKAKLYIEFKNFSLNNIHGASPVRLLSNFPQPDYSDGEHLCYFNLGLEFLVNPQFISYIYIHVQPHSRSYHDNFPGQFQAFCGEFLYDGKIIDRSLLNDCDALIESFNDSRFKLYDKSTNWTSYIEEINGQRGRTVVFYYEKDSLTLIILY